jgi:hypothetical protein
MQLKSALNRLRRVAKWRTDALGMLNPLSQLQTLAVHGQTSPVRLQTCVVQRQTCVVRAQTLVVQTQTSVVRLQTCVVQAQTLLVQRQTLVVRLQTLVVRLQILVVQAQTCLVRAGFISRRYLIVLNKAQSAFPRHYSYFLHTESRCYGLWEISLTSLRNKARAIWRETWSGSPTHLTVEGEPYER